jgi:anti-sigma factor NepR-like protein
MAGKNGSTKFTAPMAVEQAAGGGQLHNDAKGATEAEAEGATEAERQPQGEDHSQQQATMGSHNLSHDLKPSRGMLDRSLQAQLGRQLRSIFSDIASEPVPERFVKLLEELEAKEKRR